jgi:hypothetical protein
MAALLIDRKVTSYRGASLMLNLLYGIFKTPAAFKFIPIVASLNFPSIRRLWKLIQSSIRCFFRFSYMGLYHQSFLP